MPIFEYICNSCGKRFEELIISSTEDPDSVVCKHCGEKDTKRVMSTFSAVSKSDGITSSITNSGSSCTTCSTPTSCTTCGI